METTLKPVDADGVLQAVRWAAAEETPLEVFGHGSKRGVGRPVPDGIRARPLRAFRRDALRAGGTRALGEGRHGDRRYRDAAFRARPDACLRADGFRSALRRRARPRHDRRHARRKCQRPAPDQGGRGARPCARHSRRLRPRRSVQIGRARGEERHRLRPLERACRLVGHARRRHRDDVQGAAQAGGGGDARHRRARRSDRRHRAHQGDGDAVRRFRRRASSRKARRGAAGRRLRDGRPRGDADPA